MAAIHAISYLTEEHSAVGKAYNATEAARLSGVSHATIHRYLKSQKIKPRGIPMGNGLILWQFSEADIEKVKKLRAGSKPGRKKKAY
jgi:predicted DNA-binding transcriptional regulator AlpA